MPRGRSEMISDQDLQDLHDRYYGEERWEVVNLIKAYKELRTGVRKLEGIVNEVHNALLDGGYVDL